MRSLTCEFCPHCGIRALIVDDNRRLLLSHISRTHR
jgi:hypothetical protein